MKHLIMPLIATVLFLGACKKQDNHPNYQTLTTQSCSPVIALEGKWVTDSVRSIITKNGIVRTDTTMPYNNLNGYFWLNFYCVNTIPTMDAESSSVTIDPNQYRIFSNTIYIGPDTKDTSKMDKLLINSLINNHLVLKFHYENPADTIASITYFSLRKK